MKEKKSTVPVPVDVSPTSPAPSLIVGGTVPFEKLSDADKNALDLAKMKRELALSNAKTALAQSENAELAYNNVILQLALRYKLVDGDEINDAGEIKRLMKGV